MGSTKKDLEIVFHLQWKNVSGNGDDKANIVGMYDTPATTLNWDTFKSYLLKNSGTTGDDIKVSYVGIDDKEYRIESQVDFQIALYSFRERARNGDIITLKLDRIADHVRPGRMKRLRRQAESHVEEEKAREAIGTSDLPNMKEAPPDWFKNYMIEFKKEMLEEFTTAMVGFISTMKNSSQSSCHYRKSKIDCCKRPRKSTLILNKVDDKNEKDLLKSLKLERKLDSKLERLEQKSFKIREKKFLLHSNREDSITGSNTYAYTDSEVSMDASVVGQHELMVPHMSGGEIYQQDWEVINSGDLKWTEQTELRYAWGSEALKPVSQTVACPKLEPGEKGVISVHLEIPKKSGHYESYWHFYHDGRRFGHWLGCQVVVDPLPVKIPKQLSPSNTNLPPNWDCSKKQKIDVEYPSLAEELQLCTSEVKAINSAALENSAVEKEIHNMSSELKELKIYDDVIVISDSNSGSDSDNQSVVSIADSNSSGNFIPSDEFVLVPMPDNEENSKEAIDVFKIKIKQEKADEKESNVHIIKENQLDLKSIPVNTENGKIKQECSKHFVEIAHESPYAYVTINGQKVVVPKHLLRSDYLATAEDAPAPIDLIGMKPIDLTTSIDSVNKNVDLDSNYNDSLQPIETKKLDSGVFVKPLNEMRLQHPVQEGPLNLSFNHPEATYINQLNSSVSVDTSAGDKSRLFVFPLNCPGFEVVYPPTDLPENLPTLPPDLESIDSNNSAKATDGNASDYHCETVYCNSPFQENLENLESENCNYKWSKSDTAYSYTAPSYISSKCGSTPSTHCCCNDGHDDRPNTLHDRFGAYMRRRPFSHKNCQGMHCHHCFKYSRGSENTEAFTECSNGAKFYQQRCGFHGGRSSSGSPRTGTPSESQQNPTNVNETGSSVHILPDTLVSGAVNVASSAINTARSVLNMFSPIPRQEQSQWVSGHWTTNDADSPREHALRVLHEMGFWDRNLNNTLLARYNDDLARTISELVQ